MEGANQHCGQGKHRLPQEAERGSPFSGLPSLPHLLTALWALNGPEFSQEGELGCYRAWTNSQLSRLPGGRGKVPAACPGSHENPWFRTGCGAHGTEMNEEGGGQV